MDDRLFEMISKDNPSVFMGCKVTDTKCSVCEGKAAEYILKEGAIEPMGTIDKDGNMDVTGWTLVGKKPIRKSTPTLNGLPFDITKPWSASIWISGYDIRVHGQDGPISDEEHDKYNKAQTLVTKLETNKALGRESTLSFEEEFEIMYGIPMAPVRIVRMEERDDDH